ncbi:CGNR zinc finger domain-containing protein [Agromyces sp. NPDC004153]
MGGHVALDFVNTEVMSRGDPSEDVLVSAPEFLAWCAHAGVASAQAAAPNPPSQAQERAFLKEAAAVRGAIGSIIEAIADHRDPDPDALGALQAAWGDAVERAVPTFDGQRLTWTWEPNTFRAPLWELTGAAVDLLATGATERLKACPGCGFVFLDATKNGTRRWCSMDDCGKQEKIRRYVAKRSQARAAASS